MGKYLIKGALALFAGALVLSCAETETEYVPVAQQKIKAFEDVFKEVYGNNIDPYQDWGFEHAKTGIDITDESQIVEAKSLYGDVAYTRAAAFGHNGALLAFHSNTRGDVPVASWDRGANTQHNLWGDPDYHNLNIPPALTSDQKIRVMAYFQANPYLTYVDPHYTTFFVQQVYKGNPNTAGALSSEQYTQTNGTTLTGSNNMDWLYVGNNNDHVNDFNCGDYNGGNTVQVLNTSASTNDFATKSHPDQITLMINSSTEYVAFGSSTGNYYHKDCCALAGWAVIEAWANAHRDSLVAIGRFGATLNDGWNRSFVGLDYENRKIDDLYSTKGIAKAKDFCTAQYVLYNGTITEAGSFTDFELSYPNGEKVRYVTDNVSNQAIADYIKVNGNKVTKSTYNYNMSKDDFANYNVDITNQEASVYNLDMVMGYIRQSAHPTDNDGNWVKNIGGRDYVFSDWIVTLTSAYKMPDPVDDYEITNTSIWGQVERGRVFCEDLGRSAREDLDYNDVVFDAIVFSNYRYYKKVKVRYRDASKTQELSRVTEVETGPTTKYYVNVKLLAAGGTIPVSVLIGPKGSDQIKEYIVHDQFNDPAPTPTETMVNTCDNNSTVWGSYETRRPVQLGDIHETFVVTYNNGATENFDVQLIEVPESIAHISDINIWSCFNGGSDVAELQSVKGGAPQKFMAPYGTTKWASERNNISLAYPGNGTIPSFNDWVLNRNNVPWGYANTNYCYSEESPYNPDGRNLPFVIKVQSTMVTESEQELWHGSKSYGADWSLANLEASLDIDQFHAGDHLRFYATNIPTPTNGELFTSDDQKAWITVVIGSITPYFINTEFPYYIIQDGQRVFKDSGCIEVVLDQAAADLLNPYISGGKVTFQVQGRNFTLTRISRLIKKQ